MNDIFISHAEDAWRTAVELALRLEEAGYRTWCDRVDMVAGDYLPQMERAIEPCRILLLVISRRATTSNHVRVEVVRAHESGKRIVPLLAGLTYEEFRRLDVSWEIALADATLVVIPDGDVSRVLDPVLTGLRRELEASGPADQARLAKIRAVLDGRNGGVMPNPPPPNASRLARLGAWARRRAAPIVAAAAIALAVVAAVPRMVPPDRRIVVGVMKIESNNDIDPWIPTQLRARISAVLHKGDGVEVFSSDHIDFLVETQHLHPVEAAQKLGIRQMVRATLARAGRRLMLNTRVSDMGSKHELWNGERAEDEQNLVKLENEVALDVLSALKVHVAIDQLLPPPTNPQDAQAESDAYQRMLKGMGVDDEPPPPAEPRQQSWLGVIGPRSASAQTAPSDEEAIKALLEDYRRALEARDLDRLAALYVSMTDGQRAALREYFQNANDLHVRFSDVALLVEPSGALATFTRLDVFHDVRNDRDMQLEVRISTVLSKTDAGWKIKGLKRPS